MSREYANIHTAQMSLVMLLFVAIIGIFLPVPIGFDVIVAGTLLSAGLAVGFVMTLAFTLGIFSIYSFIIIGNTISWKVALKISAAIIFIGVISGYGIQEYHDYKIEKGLELLIGS